MTTLAALAVALALAGSAPAAAPVPNPLFLPETPNPCTSCAAWNRPHPPVRVFGNTWWVGVEGLSAVAIDTGAGLILLDGGLPQSALLVKASLAAAGLKLSDVKFIGNSHTHFDHAGGIAALQQASNATVLASARAAEALRAGCPNLDDPQAGYGCAENGFPQIKGALQVVGDGEVVRLGNVALTAHLTPGHTPGGTTWTWRSCEGARCLEMVYADSLTPVAADGFRFTGKSGALEASIAKVAALPCDVLLSAHPDASGTLERLSKADSKRESRSSGGAGPASKGQCEEYAGAARRKLQARLLEEKKQTAEK